MNHQQARRNLPLYADGELDSRSTAELEDRLAKSAELRAELERWRSLRRCAKRVVTAPAVPGELADRIRTGLHRTQRASRYRPLRLFGGITAIAAAIVLAVVFWPQGSGPNGAELVTADRFAEIHLGCACRKRHQGVKDIDLADIGAVRATLVELQGYPVLVPDLRDRGFELDGICQCFHVPGVDVVHAYYRSGDPEAAVVSVFSVGQKVHLKDCNSELSYGSGGLPREYEIAEARGVMVCKWDETAHSFAVCSEMGSGELRDLANSVEVASLQAYPTTLIAWARPEP